MKDDLIKLVGEKMSNDNLKDWDKYEKYEDKGGYRKIKRKKKKGKFKKPKKQSDYRRQSNKKKW